MKRLTESVLCKIFSPYQSVYTIMHPDFEKWISKQLKLTMENEIN